MKEELERFQTLLSIIDTVEEILIKNGITLPDCGKLSFSSINELNGWGNDFDGKIFY